MVLSVSVISLISMILILCYVSVGSLSINDFDVVLEAIWDARVEWFNLGLALGISITDMQVIKEEAGPSVEACFRAIIKSWLTQEEPRPTWAAMVKALQSPMVMFGNLAARIQAL